MSDFLDWDRDKDEICRSITQRKSKLKILLKTKNEIHYLQKWVDHHSNIVGNDNIVIFDNYSDDDYVVSLLSEYSKYIQVYRFSGFHNDVNKVDKKPELFEAIRNSCDYFIILDTDEFLYWCDDLGSIVPGNEIVDRLFRVPQADLIVGIWLNDVGGRDDRFTLFQHGSVEPIGLTLGKSIISTRPTLSGIVCHNFQLDGPALDQARSANVLIAHLKNALPAQRIRGNLEKLRQYNFLRPNEGVERVLTADLAQLSVSGNVRQWIKEIQSLDAGGNRIQSSTPLSQGQIAINGVGPIGFYSDSEKRKFLDYYENPAKMLIEAISRRDGHVPWLHNMNRKQVEMSEKTEPVAPPGIRIPSTPHMPVEGVNFMREMLATTECYLEYGSGGSTRLAVKLGIPAVYSVESDADFGRAVRRYVSRDIRGTRFKMTVPKIGPTNQWGYPSTKDNCGSWPSYALDIWDAMNAASDTPGLILIDGRFRVACFFVCLLQSRPGTTILFDDYLVREERYSVVKKYVAPSFTVGRLAVFVVPSELDSRNIALDLMRYAVDPR
jgi:hypothetical protein